MRGQVKARWGKITHADLKRAEGKSLQLIGLLGARQLGLRKTPQSKSWHWAQRWNMPIYEFVCQQCDHQFEMILSFSASTTPACPACGAQPVSRKMGRPALHFKGSGWYITDSKNGNGKNGKKTGEGETGSGADSTSGAEKKSNKPNSETGSGSETKAAETTSTDQ